ncbi:MAG: isopeptide-forming domain-containing fimbrial protein [Elusimicrobiota bacterium]
MNVALYDLRVQDAIPAGVTVSGISNNSAVLTPGACAAVSVTNNGSGNNIDSTYSCLPPNAQAVLIATGTVGDLAANQAGTIISNTASYTWSQTAGGATQPVISTAGIVTTLREPALTIAKTLVSSTTADGAQGLQAGDKVKYHIAVTNASGANVSDAYDLLIRDLADENLVSPVVTANTDNPGAPVTEGTSGGVTAYSWAVAGPLAAGASYAFDVEYTLGAGVQPQQALVNTSSVTWTSMAGAAAGERTGQGGVDDYAAAAPAPVTVTVGTAHLTKVIRSPGLTTYAVGEQVTYRIAVTFGQGAANAVHLIDTLPAGLAYSGVAVSTVNVQRAGGGTVSVLAGPSAGATGDLDFSLGDLASTGAGPAVYVDVTARVQDIAVGSTLTNSVRGEITSSTGAVLAIAPASAPAITVIGPQLTSGKVLRAGQAAVVPAGGAVAYRLTARNAGSGAAYNVQLKDTLPAGMRQTAPAVSTVTLNGESVAVTPSYDAGTGVIEWTLGDAQFLSSSTGSLVIDYAAQVDGNAGGGLTLTNAANVTQYYSQPSAEPVGRHQYAATVSSAATVTTPAPTDIAKSVSVSTAVIGDAIIYTIRVPATPVNVALYNLHMQDIIPAGLSVTGISDNGYALAPGSCGNINVMNNIFGNNIDLTYSCLPPNAQAVIIVTGTVSDITGNQAGTVFSNGASFTWTKSAGGAVQPAISTAGIVTTLLEPALAIDKTLVSVSTADAAQGLQAGDKVRYHIKVVNAAGANVSAAHDLVIRDYADQNLTLPAVTAGPDDPGAPVNEGTAGGVTAYSWNVAGPLLPGATYQFDVEFTLGAGLQPQQTVVNRSSVTWTSLAGAAAGERTGAGGVDDYSAADQTPVSTFVPGPVHVEKAVKAPGGLIYAVGELVTYRIAFTFGQGTVNGVHLLDALPAGLSYRSAAVSAVNAQRAGGGAAALVSGPSLGATGSLDFSLGDLQSTGANPLVHMDVTARVQDIASNVSGQTLTNSVQAQILTSTGGTVSVSPLNPLPVITVSEPLLTSGKTLRAGQPAIVNAGEAVAYRMTVANTGTGAAYNLRLRDTLPAGMRQAAPAVSTATLNGETVTITPSYDAGTGVIQWSLADAQFVSASTGSLVIDYAAQVDANEGGGLTLTNSANVTQYYSKSGADLIQRRKYAATASSAATVTTPAPTDIAKSVSVSTAVIGDTVVYTLRVPATPVNVALYNLHMQDIIPAGLSVTGISDNGYALAPGSCGNINVMNNIFGNNIDLTYSCLPPNAQAVIIVTGTVSDITGNQAGTVFSNGASFTWTKSAGGAVQPAISTAGIVTTLLEPALAIDKTLVSVSTADAAQGLQAGDKVRYHIKVVNAAGANVSAAHDLVIRDYADQNLTLPAVTAGPDDPGAPVNEGTAGGVTAYSWNVAGPLLPGATYQFDVEFTLGAGVQAQQVMVNRSSVTWTSLAGVVAGERDGSGGVNDYLAADPTPVSVIAGSAHVEKSVRSGVLTYAVGEQVTYRIDFTFGQGKVSDVHLIDALPAGLVYSGVAVSTGNVQRPGGGTVAVVSGPSAGATGNLDFSLGDLQSTGTGPVVHVDITARVKNIPENVNGQTLTNSVQAQIASSTGSVVSVSPLTPLPVITVLEPRLALALDAPAGGTIDFGVPGQFTLRAKNFGTAAAFQPTLQVELSTGLRAADPAGLPLSVAVSGGRALTLAKGTDYTVSYSVPTGVLSLVMISSSAYVGTGETLTAAFNASLENDPVNGRVFRSTGAVTQYFSRDTSSANGGLGADTRTYAFTPASANGGLADNGAILTGDDHGDNADVTVRAPVLRLIKSVTPAAPLLSAQTTLQWSVAIVNSGPVAAPAGSFSDDLGYFAPTSQYISTGSLSAVTVTSAPAGFTDSSNVNGGTIGLWGQGRGLVTLTDLVIPATTTVTVNFSVRISSIVPDQTKLYNQASLAVPGFTRLFVSDSGSGADNNAVEAGNDPANPNDDDPTSVTIRSAPGLYFKKTATDDNGGSFVVGDIVTYTMHIRNTGTERSLGSFLVDPVPPNTTYVPGSTRLNGSVVADPGGGSPLAAGLPVNTPGEPEGVLEVYDGRAEGPWEDEGEPQTVVSFSVRVSTGIEPGTRITNQGFLSGKGEGTGTPVYTPSDDPGTAPSPDPTDLIISGAAFLLSEKTAAPGVFTVAGGTLTYTVTVRNIGDTDAISVVLRDSEPVNASYIAGSLSFDGDGSGPAAPAALTDAADSDRGAFHGTNPGAISVYVGTIAAHSEVSLTFRSLVSTSAAAGTVIANQAVISAVGLPDIRSDGDGNHGNGDQPTYNVVGGAGAFLLQTKQVFDLNGGVALPGDSLEYRITTFNIGAGTATAVTVTDSVPPAHTAYSTGTTSLDGVTVADAGGLSPLVAGYDTGDIYPGQSRLLRFKVTISTSAAAGTVIDNQASFTANAGALTGVSDSNLDDGAESGNSGTDPNDDDPTRVQVGGTPGTAALNGVVWQDLDHDRLHSSGEPVEPGWTVEVLHDGLLVASELTGADGSYRIANLTPGGGYQVRFRHPVSGTVFGRARSLKPGTVLTDGTIRNLALETGENLFNQNLPLDPNGVLFDAMTRRPVSGVRVYMDGPAGFLPAAHLLPGQDGQVTAADGFYRFDINFAAGAPLGVYALRFAAPANYATSLPGIPSSIIPPLASSGLCASANCLDVPLTPDPYLVQLQNTAPAGVQPTGYYLSFLFNTAAEAAVVNNHVPLDPILADAVFVVKTAQKTDVSRGEFVSYTITARNTLASALLSISLRDLLPPGFKYRSGTATLNGAPLEPVLSGRQLDWAGLTFAPGETKTFKLLLIAGAGVSEGRYVNQAWAVNMNLNTRVSNVGAATVRVVPDPLFDCTDVLGKVFEDVDADGYQREGEKGLANVRVVTARGWVVNTDAYGRFHIACADTPNEVRGSNFIMKVDEQTLPSGYRMTTENPRVIRLTRGKAADIAFGAAPFQAVRLDLSSASFRAWEEVADSTAIPPLRFEVAKFDIKPEHIVVIRGALERVQSMPNIRNVKLKVIGHTDSSPIIGQLMLTIPNNWALSRSRAAAVGALLCEKLGLKKDMIITEGKADTEPLVPNDTSEGRAFNRRVAIQVIYERKTQHVVAAGRLPWQQAVERALTELERRPSVLRLGYCSVPGEDAREVRSHLQQVSDEIRLRWADKPDRYPLLIEKEFGGAACAGGSK